MPYRIRYADEARRALRTVPGNYRQRLRRTIEALANNCRPPQAKALRDKSTRFRITLDRWRLIYEVDDNSQIVFILRIRVKRGPETYEGLD